MQNEECKVQNEEFFVFHQVILHSTLCILHFNFVMIASRKREFHVK